MACSIGLLAEDCLADHWLPALRGRSEPGGGRAPCPVCSSTRTLSVQAKGARVVWNAHCACERDVVSKALAEAVPCHRHTTPRAARRTATPDELAALALAGMPPQSLRLGLLELAGMGTSEALDKLGVGPTHRRRVIDGLRRYGL